MCIGMGVAKWLRRWGVYGEVVYGEVVYLEWQYDLCSHRGSMRVVDLGE
jgi:hypothetical protein